MNFAHSDPCAVLIVISNAYAMEIPIFSAKMTSKMRMSKVGGLINQADEEFLFSGRISGGDSTVELVWSWRPCKRLWCTNLLLKDVRLQHAKTAYYLFEKIECKVEMAPGTQNTRKSDSSADFQ